MDLVKRLTTNSGKELNVQAFLIYTSGKTASETMEVIRAIVKGATARSNAVKFINQAFSGVGVKLIYKNSKKLD